MGPDTLKELFGEALAQAEEEEPQVVQFVVGGQRYALPVHWVQEVVAWPEHITPIPQAPTWLAGLMTLRRETIPVVLLARLFELECADQPACVLVLQAGGRRLGLGVDQVHEVRSLPPDALEQPPASLQQESTYEEIVAVCRVEGERLLSLLDLRRLLRRIALDEAAAWGYDAVSEEEKAASPEEAETEGQSFLFFRLGTEVFGVSIDYVQEIVEPPETYTVVPQAPPAIVGVVNLRGGVLPVVDLRQQLGFPVTERTPQQRIVVLLADEQPTGFIVDAVIEVCEVPESALQPAARPAEAASPLRDQVIHLADRGQIVQLLQPEQLLAQVRIPAHSLATAV
ncbi:Chemotaxis signal transduction protein [Rhodothermus profundi]|uniref:Chemotaxis protein CheW n=2 Tax=Rhodothermus profundi TaxID=633813 RepID=A0A1M6PYN3_9BACT|nr:Chemotaxis signal transduction protein [Rhodothermus profundi]